MGEELEWMPKTRLGKLVAAGKIKTMKEAIESGFPIKEYEIIDFLMPDLKDDVLDINMVQRMTDSGRRIKFRVVMAVGNGDGSIGLGQGKDGQVSPSIRKAKKNAKLALCEIKRGCGSWECDCEKEHSIPFVVTGKSGSVRITLKPAPRGVGLVCGDIPKRVLELAGVEDIWARASGDTRTTLNFAKATYDALRKTITFRA
jgi:small subunit ribosomal protein S5